MQHIGPKGEVGNPLAEQMLRFLSRPPNLFALPVGVWRARSVRPWTIGASSCYQDFFEAPPWTIGASSCYQDFFEAPSQNKGERVNAASFHRLMFQYFFSYYIF